MSVKCILHLEMSIQPFPFNIISKHIVILDYYYVNGRGVEGSSEEDIWRVQRRSEMTNGIAFIIATCYRDRRWIDLPRVASSWSLIEGTDGRKWWAVAVISSVQGGSPSCRAESTAEIVRNYPSNNISVKKNIKTYGEPQLFLILKRYLHFNFYLCGPGWMFFFFGV